MNVRACEVKRTVCQRNSIRPEESEASPGVVHPSVPVPGICGIRKGTGLPQLILAFVGLLLPCMLEATVYNVKAGGGGQYTTIQACANATVAGDTCTVYAGTYNEVVTLSHSGTGTGGVCTSCITIQVNPGDTVNVYGFSISANYVIVNGFTITDPSMSHASAGVLFTTATAGVQIINNTITQVGQGNACIRIPGSTSGWASYATFSGNNISWCSAIPGQTNLNAATGMTAYGYHLLVSNNTISHTTNGIGVSGADIVLLGNSYGPVNAATDFGPQQNHVDYVEVGITSNLLVENNYEHDILGVGGAHAWLMQSHTSSYSIQRFNTIYNVGTGYGDFEYPFIKDYNNTIVNDALQTSILVGNFKNGATNSAFINDLIYNSANPAGTSQQYYTVDSSSLAGFASGNNLAFDTSCVAGTLAGCTFGLMLTDSGNIYADPKFVNPVSDFHLQADSPALNAGRYLTTVASGDNGSGTSLIVNDAGFFQNGYGITGIDSDCIAVTTVTNHVCITAVNYLTNTLTLAGSILRSAGDHVWLYSDSTGRQVLFGTAPNIGATVDPPAPPTNLTATPH